MGQKVLCKLKKELKKDVRAYIKLVDAPTAICRDCGRVANCKSLLCKPVKINKAK